MIIGVISDSHDRVEVVSEVIERLNEEADIILHAGDLISPFIVRLFEKAKPEVHAVYGNNDGDRRTLYEWGLKAGVQIHGDFFVMREKKLFMTHNIEAYKEALLSSEIFEIVIAGHTHRAEVRREGRTLFVNPGELCGYLSGRKTYALIDVEKKHATIIEL
jgi:hypothetical protein